MMTASTAGAPGSVPATAVDESNLALAREVAREAFGSPRTRPFAVRYWNGFTEPGDRCRPRPFTLVIRGPRSLRAAFLPPSELGLGEAFLRGDLDIEGDLEAATSLSGGFAARLASPRRIGRLIALLLRLPSKGKGSAVPARRWRGASWGRRHGRQRDAAAIRYHYDVGNEFYRLWLDSQAVYSCAYFPPGVRDLDAAQEAKLEYICRKLRLRPGERLLDIGCGWGGLIRHAARHYGVEALGITLSPSQAELARRQIAEDGLADRCRVEVRDYRDLPSRCTYHKAVSVGMVEHVGRDWLRVYFDRVFRLLQPGGGFLYHGIVDLEDARPMSLATRVRRRLWREGRFLRRYVFPDGELPQLARVIRAAERAGFESRDLESLREHYVLTLRHWLARLEGRWQDAVARVGETTCRIWRLYLAASAYAFATGRIGLVQLLLSKPRPHAEDDVPITRHHLYIDSPCAAGTMRP